MQLAFPEYHEVPSIAILALKGFARRLFDPAQTYATRPNRSLRPPSACWIIDASKPAPAMTPKRSPLKRPTSSLRRSPRSPIATACSMS
jgi:hypothetical protein